MVAESLKKKTKLNSNDEPRQKFLDEASKQAKFTDLTIPDKDLKWNEATDHYDFGAIDWNEFFQVIKGNGPCNRERVATRKRAYDEGAWVREAALVHAKKKASRTQAQAA